MTVEGDLDLRELVAVFATFRPKPGETAMVGPTRDEAGNITYDLYRETAQGTGETTFHIFERYRDQEALQTHRDSAHYKAYRAAIGEHLAEPISVTVLDVINAVL